MLQICITGIQNTIFWRMLITNSLGNHWLTLYEINRYVYYFGCCVANPYLSFGSLVQKYCRNVTLTSQTLSLAHEARALFVLTLLLWCSAASGRRSCREWTVHTARRWRRRARTLRSNPLYNRNHAILVLHNRYVPVKRILKLFVLSEHAIWERAILLRRQDGASRRTVSAFPFYTLRLQYIRPDRGWRQK